MDDQSVMAAFFRRFGSLLRREAAHHVILEAISAGDSEFLRQYHWDLSIEQVTRIAESAITLGEVFEAGGPLLLLEGPYPPPRMRRA
jgi:hypothetical protein